MAAEAGNEGEITQSGDGRDAGLYAFESFTGPKNEERLMLMLCSVDPNKDPQARGDPFRTLFVARLSYDVKESDLEREFGRFGPVERVIDMIRAVRNLVQERKN